METHTSHRETTHPAASTAASVLARIESEHVVPTPRYAFFVRESAVWVLWGLSIVVGALAVSVTVYEALSLEYALYEATHHNFWTFAVDMLPYLWVAVFAVMITAAVRGLRQTKRGYRYRTRYIIVSSLAGSFLGGLVLHMLGAGYFLDTMLGQQIGYYMSMEKSELARWQAPAEGRLIGATVELTDTTPPNTIQFTDNAGEVWTITNGELDSREVMMLASTKRVRLIGTSTAPSVFHACGVFPWMFDRAMALREMKQEREQFEQKMAAHRTMMEAIQQGSHGTLGTAAIPSDELCAHLEMMERMR